MKTKLLRPSEPPHADAQLIAAMQRHAGARCHEFASLIFCYRVYAHLYQEALDQNDQSKKQQALERLQQAEIDLRKFLWECRGSVGASVR